MVVDMGLEPPSSWISGPSDAAEHALARVFFAKYSALVGLARLLVDDRGRAEEVVQEGFARTLEGWDRLRNTGDPYPYVRRTVVNLARSGMRRRLVERRHHVDRPASSPPADVAVLAGESRREVIEALRRLPRRQRECVVLRYYHDCSTQEAAEALEISKGAVKKHLHRALAAMSKTLEGSL